MQKILIKLLLFYKNFISPLFPKRCRFYPSCSQYAYEAIKKKGSLKGIFYILVRISKCHPFHPGGYDPVSPVKKSISPPCREAGNGVR